VRPPCRELHGTTVAIGVNRNKHNANRQQGEEGNEKVFVVLGSGSAFALISGSSHDFTAETWSDGQICAPCHTPHNALSSQVAPLWAHTISEENFTPYAGIGTLDASVGQPTSVSLACLSCHDGQTALDGFVGSSAGIDGTTAMGATAVGNLGTDLTNDHPVSFTYNDALAGSDNGLHLASSLDNTVTKLFGSAEDQLECATCHDVHRGDETLPSMLVMSNAGSNLCLECHNK